MLRCLRLGSGLDVLASSQESRDVLSVFASKAEEHKGDLLYFIDIRPFWSERLLAASAAVRLLCLL